MKIKNPYLNKSLPCYKDVSRITQCLRFKAINKILKNGLPDEKYERIYFLNLLKSCDETSMGIKKLEEEAILNDVKVNTMNVVKSVLSEIKVNPFLEDAKENYDEAISKLNYNFVEGEDCVGIDRIVEEQLDSGD